MITRRALIFLVVGLFSSAAYLATMSASIELLGLSVLVAATLAFVVGTAVSYAGNTIFTFKAKSDAGTFGRFLVVVLIGMALNQLIAYTLDRLGAHYVLIWLAVFILIPGINFLGHSFFTYRERSVEGG